MSVPQSALAQMLMQQGGQGVTPQMGASNAMQGGSNIMQKLMMIQALKNAQNPQQQAPGQPPNPTTMGAPGLPGQAVPQLMNQNPMTSGVDA